MVSTSIKIGDLVRVDSLARRWKLDTYVKGDSRKESWQYQFKSSLAMYIGERKVKTSICDLTIALLFENNKFIAVCISDLWPLDCR